MSSSMELLGSSQNKRDVPTSALILGYSGLLPFIAGAVLSHPVAAAYRSFGATLLIDYGAIILSFMGGVHWGAAMMLNGVDSGKLTKSVLPSLAALLGILVGGPAGLLILALGFIGLLLYDEYEVKKGQLTRWYPYLRRPLTTIVVISLLFGAYAQIIQTI